MITKGANTIFGIPKGIKANKQYQVIFRPDAFMTISDGFNTFTLLQMKMHGKWECSRKLPVSLKERN